MTVPKDDAMDNTTTAGEYDDFDALLDASSLGAPHVLAARDPIPAAVNDRLRSARTHHAETSALPDAVEQGGPATRGNGVGKEAPDPQSVRDTWADHRGRGALLFLSTGSGKTHASLAPLLQTQRDTEAAPRTRAAVWLHMERSPDRDELWSDCEALWSLLMGRSAAQKWAQLIAQLELPAVRRPAPPEYAERASPLITATDTALSVARLAEERLRTDADALWQLGLLSRPSSPPQMTRWPRLLEELRSTCDVAQAMLSEDERTLMPPCPHDHRRQGRATKQPPPCSAAALSAHLAATCRRLGGLDAATRLLMARMPQSDGQELDLHAVRTWPSLEGADEMAGLPVRAAGHSARADLTGFIAQVVNHTQEALARTDTSSGTPPWAPPPVPLLRRRPRTSVRAWAEGPSAQGNLVQPRSRAKNEAAVLHADFHMAWHADEAQRGIPVPARFTYRARDPFAVTAVFYPQEPEETVWTFARDLLSTGMHGSAGEGDVIVWSRRPPLTDTAGPQTFIRLRSPEGTALLSLTTTHLADYLEQTQQLVPSGSEHHYLSSAINDFERELERDRRPAPGR